MYDLKSWESGVLCRVHGGNSTASGGLVTVLVICVTAHLLVSEQQSRWKH